MFLVRKTCRNAVVKAMQCIPIHCVCRMLNMDGTPMIECCDCGEWFNIDCISPSPAALNNTDEPWYCTECNEETSSLCLYVLYIHLACEFHRISTWWRPLLALIFTAWPWNVMRKWSWPKPIHRDHFWQGRTTFRMTHLLSPHSFHALTTNVDECSSEVA